MEDPSRSTHDGIDINIVDGETVQIVFHGFSIEMSKEAAEVFGQTLINVTEKMK